MNRRVLVSVIVGLVLCTTGCGDEKPTGRPTGSATFWQDRPSQWVSFRNVEVRAPADWHYDLAPAEPSCIARSSSSTADRYARDVPTSPYILLGLVSRRPPLWLDCSSPPRPGDPDPDPTFGEIPFRLWQPHLALDVYLPDQGPEGRDVDLTYRGWHLVRTTVSGIQVTVLSAPGDEGVGPAVLASLRKVRTSTIGCSTAMPPALKHFGRPVGTALPSHVGAIAACLYAKRLRREQEPGLEASRLITGRSAVALARAIRVAPLKSSRCASGSLAGDRMVLRFFASDQALAKPSAEAYVYLDTCFRDGIMTADGLHAMTRANCSPLFARPPLAIWSGTPGVVQLCHTSSRRDVLP